MSAGLDDSAAPQEQQLQFAPVLDAWASSIASLRTPIVPVVEWPAERARRHGLSYPTEPDAALAAKIVGLLKSGPQSPSRLAKLLDVEEHVVTRRLRQLRQDGDVILIVPTLWSLTA